MNAVIATRQHNGMDTAYFDVWDGLVGEFGYKYIEHDLLIASPPCQTFSMAGKGSGRDALDKVLMLILEEAYKRPAELMAFGTEDGIDPRTALVLSPLAHVWRDRPVYVTFEQVPPVLPIWEACAAEMRKWGYSVWVGYLHAEQYGVPQTRKRAILIARRDGMDAHPPKPTHSRYYPKDPTHLDAGVEKWVSMAEALGWGVTNYQKGWGFTERPAVTVGNAVGRGLIGGQGAKDSVVAAIEAGSFIPSVHALDDSYAEQTRIPPTEAGLLQSYPLFEFQGTKTQQFLQIGNAVPPLLAYAILKGFL